MHSFLLQLAERQIDSASVIIHIGTGNCPELSYWKSLDPNLLVLVEPNPSYHQKLKSSGGDPPKFQVIEAALAPKDGKGKFHLCNNPMFSYLRKPNTLESHYPSVKTEAIIEVDTLRLASLLDKLELGDKQDRILIAELGGEYPSIINSARKTDLKQFQFIIIRTLHDAPEASATLVKKLSGCGFSVTPVPDPLSTAIIFIASKTPQELSYEDNITERCLELEREGDEIRHRESQLRNELGRLSTQVELLKELMLHD